MSIPRESAWSNEDDVPHRTGSEMVVSVMIALANWPTMTPSSVGLACRYCSRTYAAQGADMTSGANNE